MIIVDSFANWFKSDYPILGNLMERQTEIRAVLNYLSSIAQVYGPAILLTNEAYPKNATQAWWQRQMDTVS